MDWTTVYEEFHRYLHLYNFPVGVTLFEKKENVPASVRWIDRKVNVCQQVALARLYGWTSASGPEEQVCVLGASSVGLINVPQRVREGKINYGVYQKDLAAAKRMQKYLPKMSQKHEALVTFSLTRVPEGLAPKVIIIYGNSAQMMRLVQAALWEHGGELRMASSGDGGVCCRGIAQTFMTHNPTLEIPCLGDRRFAVTQDTELIFAFPATMASEILEGLKATYKAGSRYPIPTQMDWAPHMPEGFFVIAEDY
jgi:uncharacterized protein (DUF169 family)